jgi:RNA ligase (TIGR02306 family)
MADWKVSREKIELIPHPNPEVQRLELAKVGQYQFVVGKGLYKDGDIVVCVPDKSILPDSIANEGDMRKYLSGPDKNRVKAIKLQKELSCGVLLPDQPGLSFVALGDDISESLGIKKYEPPIPAQLAGRVKPVGNIDTGGKEITRHDVEQFNLHINEFDPEETVVVTEKIHGSQIAIIRTIDGRHLISSKGLLGRMLTIDEDENNTYWQAANNTNIFEYLDQTYSGQHVQVFGEVFPCQKSFTYGQDKPTMAVFRVEVDGKNLNFNMWPSHLVGMTVPTIYIGQFKPDYIRTLRSGKEQVSGKELHIREGVVVSPAIPRLSKKGNFPLYLKIINPDYKETGEEFN